MTHHPISYKDTMKQVFKEGGYWSTLLFLMLSIIIFILDGGGD